MQFEPIHVLYANDHHASIFRVPKAPSVTYIYLYQTRDRDTSRYSPAEGIQVCFYLQYLGLDYFVAKTTNLSPVVIYA